MSRATLTLRHAVLCAGLIAMLSPQLRAASVTVDLSKRDQTIEGFGAFGCGIKSWTPFATPELAHQLVDDLGLTISRGPLPFDFVRADGSLNEGGDISKWIPVWKTLKTAGVQKFIISVWSPPPWLKNPGNHGHPEAWCADGRAGGFLPPENDGRFADACVAFLRYFKSHVGTEVFALSIQNEPAFDEPYESCVYTPQRYAAVMKTVGEHIAAAGLATRLFGPEDIGYLDRVMSFINAIPTGSPRLGFVAVHGYAANGITPDSADARTWQTMHDAAATRGKELWMTETSGYGRSWDDAMGLARALYTSLRFGRVSGWCWWQAVSADENTPGAQSLLNGPDGMSDSPKTGVLKNFARFVRPGAVRVEATSDDPNVLPLAFDDGKTLTLVLINPSSGDLSLEIKPAGPAAIWHVHRSSATENCVDGGDLPNSSAVALPAGSVTTLQRPLAFHP